MSFARSAGGFARSLHERKCPVTHGNTYGPLEWPWGVSRLPAGQLRLRAWSTIVRSTADSRWRTDEDGNLLMPAKQAEFLEWLVADDRHPTSQARWCVENDVHERTVQGWKRDPRFVAEWERRLQEKNTSPERIQAALDAIWAAAKTDFKAAEAYLKYVERFMPAPEKRTADKGIRDMSDEELDAALAAL